MRRKCNFCYLLPVFIFIPLLLSGMSQLVTKHRNTYLPVLSVIIFVMNICVIFVHYVDQLFEYDLFSETLILLNYSLTV